MCVVDVLQRQPKSVENVLYGISVSLQEVFGLVQAVAPANASQVPPA